MSDHRVEMRRKVLKAGIVSYNQGHSTIPCRVADFSEHGGRIITEGSIGLPDTFKLSVELDGMSVDCVVVWRRKNQAGVRFVSDPVYKSPKRIQVVDTYRPDVKPALRRKDAKIYPTQG